MAKIFICHDCGEIFDEPRSTKECLGEYWGSPAWDDSESCPYCGSEDYEEAEECLCCGEVFTEEDLVGDLCEDCLHKHNKDWYYWYQVCEDKEDGE